MKVLPPGLQAYSSHTFGSLYLQISDIRLNKSQALTHFTPKFMGENVDQNINVSNTPLKNANNLYEIWDQVEYKLVTNLWHFYCYFSDMQSINIQLYSNSNKSVPLFVKAQINLRPVKQVMNSQFKDKNILFSQDSKKHSIIDTKGNTVGHASIKIWTQFDMAIHQQIKELINFNEMVIFQGISPINSQNQLPREPPQQFSTFLSESNHKYAHTQMKQSTQKEPFQLLQSEIKANDVDYHRLMQEDIDKLIMEMQAKPYDSSRYQEQKNQVQKQVSRNKINKSNSLQQNFSSMQRNSDNQSQNYHKFLQTEASLKHIPPSRPPSYSPYSKKKIESTHIQNRTIISNSSSQKIIKGQNLSNRSYSQSFPKGIDSYIQLKIHQLQFSLANAIPHTMFSQLVQPCYTIKIYLNSDLQQFFAGQGVKQGEIIKFNLSLKLRNIANIQKLKFTICDDYGKIQCEGIFDLSRMYNNMNQKGVFIVSLMPIQNSQPKQQMKVQQSRLMEVSPLVRTLRIQAQLVERVEMVQIFIKISKVTLPFNMLRYKIPLTKQTIQFVGNSHINIFPHSCSQQVSDKIIVQFWRNQQNIGQSQISLKNIRNINVSTLNTNLDPTYLYDGNKQIKNILQGDKTVGNFNLFLCFGTVKQIQSLLLSTIQSQKQVSKQQSIKVPATIDQRLGIVIHNKPVQKNQISIQVQIQQPKAEFNTPKQVQEVQQVHRFNEPSFGDQSMISQTSQNQFMDASLMSFSKNPTLQQVIKTQQDTKNKIMLPSVTQKISQTVCEILSHLCQKISKIKQLCKPHLLYNFITVDKLTEVLIKLNIPMKLIKKLFKVVLFAKQNMINVNILYDLCANSQIEGAIKPHLISDEMLIVIAMRLLYKNQQIRKTIILQSDMQFKQMAAVFKKVGLKLTLHQFQVLQKFMNKYETKKDAQQLKLAIINQLQQQTMQELRDGFYQQDILQQIYGNDSSISQSQLSDYNQSIQPQKTMTKFNNLYNQSQFKRTQPVQKVSQISSRTQSNQKLQTSRNESNKSPKFARQKSASKSPKVNKQQKWSIIIDGVQNVVQSAQCVLDMAPKNCYFRLVIQSPIFEQLVFNIGEKSKQFQANQQLKDIDGRADFVSDGKVVACAAFSLIRGVDSLYPMKTKDGHFCGLLKIKIQ